MDAPGNLPTGDELLRHAQWIRRLAGGLLRDEGAAEDLVQDTWVAALTHSRSEARLRPWLRQVVRNFARQHHRGSARRADRERASRPPGGLPGPEELFERLEIEQRLTHELARLEEPFRSTLMLRYYEDLEPAVIAERLGAPGGTVRWRLKRGLELLRERLDETHGGDRSAWSLALLPLARIDGAVAAGAAVSAVALPGLIAMNLLKIVGAAAALLVLAFGLSVTGMLPASLTPWSPSERPMEVGFRPLENEPDAMPAPAPAPLPVEAARTQAAHGVEPEPAPRDVAPLARLDARILGRGRALAGARMVVVRGDERLEPVVSSADGSVASAFDVGPLRELVTIELHALGFASQAQEAVCEGGTTTHLGPIELAPGGVVSGRVVDPQGLGLAGCRVTIGAIDPQHRRLDDLRLMPAESDVPGCTSDAQGRFRLLGAPAGMLRLWAHAPGRMAGYTPPFEVREGQESFGVELVLEPLSPANLVRGVVVDPSGAPVPHAELAYRHSAESTGNTTSGDRSADAEGRFEFVLPRDARTWLTASDPAGRWSPASVSDLATGSSEVVLRLIEARRVELVAKSRGGGAVTRLGLEIRAPEDGPVLSRVPSAEREDGRTSFVVPTEAFVVRVTAAGHQVLDLGPFDPSLVAEHLEALLEPVSGLHGVVLRDGEPVGGVRVRLRAAVGTDSRVEKNGFRVWVHPDVLDEATSDAEGRFLLTARAAGSYFVRAEPEQGAPTECGPLQIASDLGGPPLELLLGSGGAIEGRVFLSGGGDPEGSIVAVTRGDGGARTQRVGPDGRYRFERLMPGPWRVELHEEEIVDSRTSVSSTSGHRVEPFELDSNCTVHEGQTTFFDVSDGADEGLTLEGRLTIRGEPALGWSAHLGPSGQLDFEGKDWQALDAQGHFSLRARKPGRYRLFLHRGDETSEQFLFDEVTVGGAPWEHDMKLGALAVTGAPAWNGDKMPPFVYYQKAPDGLIALATPMGGQDGYARLEVPAGKGALLAPRNVEDLEQWPRLREVEVPIGGEVRVELHPADLEPR